MAGYGKSTKRNTNNNRALLEQIKTKIKQNKTKRKKEQQQKHRALQQWSTHATVTIERIVMRIFCIKIQNNIIACTL